MRFRSPATVATAALAVGSLVPVLVGAGTASAPATKAPTSAQRADSARTVAPVWKTFSTTAGRGTKITVSTGGNIIGYMSPTKAGSQYEHIGVGALSEGYIACYNAVNAYDTGASGSGFGTPVPTAQDIKRTTTDGKLLLTQSFQFIAGSETAPSTFVVKMAVKNQGAQALTNVIVRRQVDFDIDTGGAQGWAGFLSNHSRTKGTVMAWHDPTEAPAGLESHGISMGVLQTAGAPWYTRVTSAILDSGCDPVAAPLDANFVSRGDFGDTIGFPLGTLNPGATKTVAIRYMRF